MNKKKILVVDDSMTNIVLLNGILDDEGYNVSSTINPKEGLSMIEHNKPDLILLDLKMPEISGYKFLEKLYAKEKNKKIPVIVVTAFQEDECNNYPNCIKDVIMKPIEIEQLVKKVKKAFES